MAYRSTKLQQEQTSFMDASTGDLRANDSGQQLLGRVDILRNDSIGCKRSHFTRRYAVRPTSGTAMATIVK